MSPFDAPAGAGGNGTSSATSPGRAVKDTWIGGLLIVSAEMTTQLDFSLLARSGLAVGCTPVSPSRPRSTPLRDQARRWSEVPVPAANSGARGPDLGAWARRTGARGGLAVVFAAASLAFGAFGASGAEVSAPSELHAGDGERADARAARRQLRGVVRSPPATVRLPPPTADERDPGPRDEGRRPASYRVGFGRAFAALAVDVPDQDDLVWQPTADGGRAATLAVASPGASALRAQLRFDAVPAGLEVRVYDPTGGPGNEAMVTLPEGPPAAPGTLGSVWTATVDGATLAIEFYLPAGSKTAGLRFSIPRLSHLDVHPMRLIDIGDAYCSNHVDVACRTDAVSDVARRATAKYAFTTRTGRSSLCSGTLLNDLDASTQIPYFLTAEHCVETEGEARSMELYWFFERSRCGGPAPTHTTRQSGGATRLAWERITEVAGGTDFALLRLNRSPPRGAGLSGWTSRPLLPGDRLVNIHHPAGDLKKISASVFERFGDWREGPVPTDGANLTHHVVLPETPTEGGSSGSGLWARRDGADHLVGMLTGGLVGCEGTEDWFGRFDRFYPQISQWLGGEGGEGSGDGSPITRLVLVDAVGGGEVADLWTNSGPGTTYVVDADGGGEVDLTAGGATVDLGDVGTTSFDIVAETVGVDGAGNSVRLELSGRQSAASTSGRAPYALFGEGGGTGLAPGDYTVSATAYASVEDGGQAWPPVSASFAVTGTAPGDPMSVAGLALVDPASGRMLGVLEDDAVLDLFVPTGADGAAVLAVRARTAGGAAVGSVAFSVAGAATLDGVADDQPFNLPATLPVGTYRFAATPYPGAAAAGTPGTGFAAERVAVSYRPSAVAGFTLVDAADGAPDPDLGAITDGATVDVSALPGGVSVRVDVDAPPGDIGSVRVLLDGPASMRRTDSAAPYSLAGDNGGNYTAVWLPNGDYTLAAQPFAGAAATGAALTSRTVSFAVRGSFEAGTSPVTGFTLVDARAGAPDDDLEAIQDGATLDVSAAAGRVSVRVDVAADRGVRSVRLALGGARVVERVENSGGPYTLFGDDGGGDYWTGFLPNGDYTLTATPYAGRGAAGAALPAATVSFTVAGGPDGNVVTGFTRVDPRGPAPDPDIGALTDGATVDVSTTGGEFNVRAEVVDIPGVRSVAVVLEGRSDWRRVTNGAGPYTLYGQANGNYAVGFLPDGDYTLTATAHAAVGGGGDALHARAVSFTVTGFDANHSFVTGFTLVDARGGPPDPDLGAIADGATVDVSAANGRINVRADVPPNGQAVGSVKLELRGARDVTRIEEAGSVYTLFGDDTGSDYWEGSLPAGAYTLTATPYSGGNAGGDRLRPRAVSFTVTGFDANHSFVTGFTLVDARGGPPDPDLGAIADGATVDVSAANGRINVRADVPPNGQAVGSVKLELRGARDVTRIEQAGSVYTLFGDDTGSDYWEGNLPAGAYTLTATPYSGGNAGGDRLLPRAIAFTVAGETSGGSTTITGFTLVDARGGPPDPDLGAITDGATVDVSAVGGRINIRADVAASARAVHSVTLELEGPRDVTRTEQAGSVYTLFGDDTGDDYWVGFLPDGDYTLKATAHPLGDGVGRVLEVAFTVTGYESSGSPVTGFTLVDARGGPPDPDLRSIEDGAAVDVSAGGGRINVRADTAPDAQGIVRVKLELSGRREVTRVEQAGSVYTLFGDTGSNYREGELPVGAYSLVATPYADGRDLRSRAIRFTVVPPDPPAAVTGFAMVDPARPAEVLATVGDGTVLDLAALAATAEGVDIRPVLAAGGALPGSVRIELGGTRSASHLAESSPFYLFGTQSGGVPGGVPMATGEYSITATTFTQAGGQGLAQEPATARFTVVSRPLAWEAFALPADGAAASLYPSGLWSDGTALWIADLQSAQVFAFATADKARLPSRDIATAARQPAGLWSDGTTLRVADYGGGKLYAYRAADGAPAPAQDIELAAGNASPSGLWSDGDTLWVADYGARRVFAYGLAAGERRPAADLETAAAVKRPWGLWSDGDTLWVADWTGGAVRAYGLADGARRAHLDIDTAAHGNANPMGLYSDGVVLWASDSISRRVYAYAVPGPASVSIAPASTAVAEGTAAAFALTRTRAPDEALDVSVSVAETGAMLSSAAPATVRFAAGSATASLALATLDDAVVEPASVVTATVRTGSGYTVPSPATAEVTVADDDAAAFSVTASPASLAEGAASTLTVSTGGVTFATAQSIELSVVAGTAAADDYGLAPGTLTLAPGAASVAATLTAVDDGLPEPAETATVAAVHDGVEVGRATVTILPSAAPSADATLSAFALSGIDIGTFAPETTSYAARVALAVTATTATATPNDPGAAVVIADAAGSTAGTARTVALAVGANVVAATVTAADGATTRTYSVAVARSGPDIDTLAAAGNAAPRGLWGNGEVLWVTDYLDSKLYAYAQADGARLPARDVDTLSGARYPTDAWSDGETLWVSDNERRGVYAYRLADGARAASRDIALAAENGKPNGVWGDGETLWVLDATDRHAYAYRLADGTRAAAAEFALADPEGAARLSPWGLWSDGEVFYVVSWPVSAGSPGTSDRTAYAYRDGARAPEADVGNLANARASGLWSDGETLWVSEHQGNAKLYAYALPSRSSHAALVLLRLEEADLGPFTASATAYAAAVPHTTARVTLTAHGAAGTRIAHSAADADPAAPGQQADLAAGANAIEVVVTAADGTTTRTYTVTATRAAGASDDATLSALALSGIDIGAFSPATTSYRANVGRAVSETTVTATPAHAGATVAIADADGSTAGGERTVALAEGANTITVAVAAEDGTTTTYTATVTRASEASAVRAPSADATLSSLGLSGVDIGAFSAATTSYRADVAHAASETTVTATPAHAAATVAIADADGSTAGGERTVALAEGANTITVAVAAEDGTTLAYTATVTRAAAAPLTASFEDVPAAHDGATAFAFGLRFSEPVRTSFRTLRDEHLAVDGGTATRARRVDGNSAHWSVAVRPDGAGDVAVRLPADVACDAGGVCTADGRRLANAPSATVAGPASSAVLADASVSGPLVTLRYAAPLDAGSVPSGADFVVLSGAATAVPVRSVGVAASDAVLTLARAVLPGERIALSYLAAPMHPLQDAAWRPAAPLTDVAVRNETPDGGLVPTVATPAPAAAVSTPSPVSAMAMALPEGRQRLDLSSRGLADLSALRALPGLEELDLRGNAVADLAPLADLRALRVLDLSDNRVRDLWPLAGLAALERLDLSGNRVADVSALSSLTRLEVLRLDGNGIADVVPLWSLQALLHLGLADNRVADVGLLAELASLKRLDLSGNAVADVSPLGDLSQLVWLRLPGNPVADASPLGRLTRLRWLWLDADAAGRATLAAPRWLGDGTVHEPVGTP